MQVSVVDGHESRVSGRGRIGCRATRDVDPTGLVIQGRRPVPIRPSSPTT